MPTLYVIAGPNGVGKTTSSYSIVPSDTPIVNSDEIAKEVRKDGSVSLNVQEFSNEKAIRLMEEQRNQKNSFAIETNLADVDTWKFLIEIKKTGYDLHVIYMSTSSLSVLNNRITERVKQGEHYVKPEVVEERYIAGLNLLNHYFEKPDRLQLFDNSEEPLLVLEVMRGQVTYKIEILPDWVNHYLNKHLKKLETQKVKISDLKNIEEVRDSYKALQQNTDSPKNSIGQKQIQTDIESLQNKVEKLDLSEKSKHKKRQKPKR